MNTSRVELLRTHDSGGAWPGYGRRLSAERRDETVSLLREARELLGVSTPDAADIIDHDSAHCAVNDLWAHAVGALETAHADNTPRFVGLLHWIKSASERLTEDQLHGRDAMFQRVREALALLREADSTGQLVEQSPSAVCSLGFDRAIVSRIEDSFWIPENAHVDRDATWAQEILEAGRSQLQQLTTSLLETEIVRRKAAVVVHNVQERADMHRPIAEASMAQCYGAAPITAEGRVIGFVHADCLYQRRNLDEVDRNLLAMFGEGLGQALARTTVLDQLGSLRAEVDHLASSVASAREQPAWSGFGAPAPTENGTGSHQPGQVASPSRGHASLRTPPTHPLLTRREMDVLAHLASGDTNARIARRLVVSEGTVKSHVKHILRKLGAANRAEAVSYWMRSEHGSGQHAASAASMSARR